MKTEVQFMIRVKLPPLSEGVTSPSGDPAEDRAYKDAIFAAKPYGFEVQWNYDGPAWPIDSQGYTYVPLFVSTTEAGALNTWIDRYYQIREAMASVTAKASELLAITKCY